MYVFDGQAWQEQFLDYALRDEGVRVQVAYWWPIERITETRSVKPKDWRVLWNYLWKIGPKAVIRKVLARSRETLRNKKVLAIGLGTVCETRSEDGWKVGDVVVFVAPCHPPAVERVVLPSGLLLEASPALAERVHEAGGLCLVQEKPPAEATRISALAGWSEYSGNALPEDALKRLQIAMTTWEGFLGANAEKAGMQLHTEQSETREMNAKPVAPDSDDRTTLQGVLYGLGNHAKTVLLPNLGAGVRVVKIHEVDPTQISPQYHQRFAVDTSPAPRPGEEYDIHFIAGFHHTHAELAVHALDSGAWAVVEKPLVTTREELEALTAAMKRHPGKLFSGFHKRYNPLWAMAREDLSVGHESPVNVNCLIYEVDLPRLHWYTWANSRSRVVSNGCHWLDLFLFLNDFAEVARYDLWVARNLDVHMSVELCNGASFSAALTDIGSRRLGTQDVVEARAGDVTVRVLNDSEYMAEDSRRVLRKCRRNSIRIYEGMYRLISEKICRGEEGDSVQSVQRTSQLMLDLDDLLVKRLPDDMDLWNNAEHLREKA